MAAFLEKRRIYAARWGDGSEDMSTESDAVADDEHVCVFVLYRTSAGLSEASIYPNSSHFVEYLPIHGSVDIDIMIHTSFRFEHGWLFN